MEVLQRDVVFIVFVFQKKVPAFLWSFYQNWCRVLYNISDALLIRSLSFVGGLCDFCRGTGFMRDMGEPKFEEEDIEVELFMFIKSTSY